MKLSCQATRTILVISILGPLLSGCSTPTPSSDVKALTQSSAAMDLSKYQVATVVPFDSSAEGVKDPAIGETFCRNIAWRLRNSYGPIFSEVNQGSASNRADELIITGKLTKYNPGNRDLRFALGLGLGTASLDGSLILKDAADQHIVYQGEFSKLWGWGGAMGACRGIEDMEAASIAAIGNTIATAKGWKPPYSSGDKHPAYSDYVASLAPLTANQARIWIYRASFLPGSAVTFMVRLDGAYVGTAVNGGFFCVNAEPGRHEITAEILPRTASATVDVTGGKEVFVAVRLRPTLPKPQLMDESEGVKEIAKCHLKGD